MTEPGWYPDPSGQFGMLRHWDGSQWSAEVVPAPPSGAQPTSFSPPTDVWSDTMKYGPPQPLPPGPGHAMPPGAYGAQPPDPYGASTGAYGTPAAAYGATGAPGQPTLYGQPTDPYGAPAGSYGQPAAAYGPPGDPYGQAGGYGQPGGAYGSQPPGPYGFGPLQPAPAKKPIGLLVGILVGVLALLLVGYLAYHFWYQKPPVNPATTDTPTATQSPVNTPTGTTPTENTPPNPPQPPSPSPTQTVNPNTVVCPDPAGKNPRASHPNDDRVYGGVVSYPKLGSPWSNVTTDVTDFPFGQDVAAQSAVVQANYDGNSHDWVAEVMVGKLDTGSTSYSLKDLATTVNQCVAEAYYGDGPIKVIPGKSQSSTTGKYPSIMTDTTVSYSISGLNSTSDEVLLILFQTSTTTASFFLVALPDGAPQSIQTDITTMMDGVRVS